MNILVFLVCSLGVNSQFFNASYYKNGTSIISHSLNRTSNINIQLAPLSSQMLHLQATYKLQPRKQQLDRQVEQLDRQVQQPRQQLGQLDRQVGQLDRQVGQLDRQVQQPRQQLRQLDRQLNRQVQQQPVPSSIDVNECKLRLNDTELRLMRSIMEHDKDLLALEVCNDWKRKYLQNNPEVEECTYSLQNHTNQLIYTRTDLANCLAQNIGLRVEVNMWALKCNNIPSTTTTVEPHEELPKPQAVVQSNINEEWNFSSCMQELNRVKITLVGCKHVNSQLVYNSTQRSAKQVRHHEARNI